MNNSLKVTPKATDVKTGIDNVKAVAGAITDALADTYRLMFKTHAYHWNVEGPLFYSIHKLTEHQYENLFAAADGLAERIRALGQLAPMNLSEIMDNSVIKDLDKTPTARGMVEDLASNHERVAHRLHALAKLAGDANDIVTEDMAVARSAFHEQAAWMLRSIAAE